MGLHFLLQGIFPIQGSNLGLHHFHQYLVSISLTFFLLWGVAIAELSHIPPALILQSLPTTNIPSFATTDESRLTHHSHPQSIVYISKIRHAAAAAAKSLQSCLTLCDPMDRSPPGSSVNGMLQTRILEWVVTPFSWGSSQSRDRTWVSCIAGRLVTF